MVTPIIDAHAHASRKWYAPVESLLDAMDRTGIAGALLVQIMGEFDNSYLLACGRDHPTRFRSVALVDHQSPNAIAELERLAGEGIAGLRLTPSARSPGDDPLALWRAAGRLGLPVSCLGDDGSFLSPDFAALAAAVPEVAIVMEHLGGANGPDVGESRARSFELARLPNVYIKLPGAGELVERVERFDGGTPFARSAESLVRPAIESFGPDRVMWGSDFPLVMAREGYDNALRSALDACHFLTDDERGRVFGGVARQLFGFGGGA